MRATRATGAVMLLCAAGLTIGSKQAGAQGPQESPRVTEQRLGRPGRALDVVRSLDGLRIAWVKVWGNKVVAVLEEAGQVR